MNHRLSRLRCEAPDERLPALRSLIALTLAFALTSCVRGEPLKIVGPSTVEPYRLVELSTDADVAGAAVIWDVFPEELADVREQNGQLTFVAPPGVYRVKVRLIRLKDGKTTVESARHVVTIGKPGPVPPGPDPVPPPGPVPIPGPGNHVLIIYESAEEAKLPVAQRNLLYDGRVRAYLNSKCPTAAAQQSWKIWDKDVDATNAEGWARDALKRPRTAVPWVIISNGTSGYEGPLPADYDGLMNLLKTHLGA